MSVVQTARGPIDSSQLGRTLVHEHIFAMDHEYTANYRPDFTDEKAVPDAAADLNALKASGIDTIIDLTVLGLGRYVPRIAKVAELTDLNIVVATGAWTTDLVPKGFTAWGPGLTFPTESEPMVDLFVRDIVEGINGTSVKAGELKCAIDFPGLTKGVERVMRAVGKTHVITGTPITVHTAPQNESGLVAQRVFKEEGVDLQDVIIGHCGDTKDLDYLMKLADEGSILGMDRFGLNSALSTPDRVEMIVKMIDRGYLEHLTLSHDCQCFSDFWPSMEARAKLLPDYHFRHISHAVIPALREAGVTEAQLDAMFVENPRRHFEGAARRFAARA
jgi:phosphotriesterase-related protein